MACTASTSSTSTEMPGAAMSSLPTIVTWAEGFVGEARVTTHPMSIATSKPSSPTKKSRVWVGRPDLTFGTTLPIVTPRVLSDHPSRGESGDRLDELGAPLGWCGPLDGSGSWLASIHQ